MVLPLMSSRTHRGSDLRDFLKEEGLLEEVETRALKRAIALQLEQLRKEQSLSKSTLALRMKTSRAAVDRLLRRFESLVNPSDPGEGSSRFETQAQGGTGARVTPRNLAPHSLLTKSLIH